MFRFALAVFVCGATVGILGWAGGAWAAAGVAVGLALGFGAALYLSRPLPTAEPAIWEQRPGRSGERRPVLAVAPDDAQVRELLEATRALAGARARVEVLVPPAPPALAGAVEAAVTRHDAVEVLVRGLTPEDVEELRAALAVPVREL